jgi:hypothetical protein
MQNECNPMADHLHIDGGRMNSGFRYIPMR